MVIRGAMHATVSMMGSCMLYLMPRGFLGPLTLSLAFPKDSPLRGLTLPSINLSDAHIIIEI
ncbi:hypothetical protein E2C01_023484 [Portunus trituberculatus]|uniref:Uncharacterized protein n=1 Tax=Portunus trituberculatus TaxID=210409 RepID=A0A5B7EBN9_PORTR|nr:hypothetical protein [Portunus trituberculatus]